MAEATPLQQLIDELEVGEREIQDLAARGVIPKPDERGQYDVVACRRAYRRHLQELVRKRTSPEDRSLNELRAEKLAVEIDVRRVELEDKRFDLDVKQGLYVPAHEVETTWSNLIVSFVSQLTSLPSSLSPELAQVDDPVAIEALLTRALDNAITQLREAADPDDLDDEDPEAEEPDEAGAARAVGLDEEDAEEKPKPTKAPRKTQPKRVGGKTRTTEQGKQRPRRKD